MYWGARGSCGGKKYWKGVDMILRSERILYGRGCGQYWGVSK